MTKIRLHQFLSQCGIFDSKSAMKDAIWAGRVMVGSAYVKDIHYQFNPQTRVVTLDGKVLQRETEHVTFAINKPSGFVCSRLNHHEKSHQKVSIFEHFQHLPSSDYERLVTVGRLDEMTTGLLLVTTDGEVVHRIANPSSKISKTYLVKAREPVQPASIERLRTGVDIELEKDGQCEVYTTLPAIVDQHDDFTVSIIIREGKKRQIRRMFEQLGHGSIELQRTAIGNLVLEDMRLELGEWKALDESEIHRVFSETS